MHGARIVAHTDNVALQHCKTAANIWPRLVRWLYDVEQYHITFEHIPGVSNTAADALSRICPLIENEDSWLPDYKADPVLRDKYFKAGGTLLDGTHFSRGRIWDVDRIVVPTARVTEVLRNHHPSVLSGHWSTAKTRDLVER